MGIAEELGRDFRGEELDQLCVNTIRTLAMDAVQKANSGHPGLPMGCADLAYVLWTKFLKFNPADPGWPDRDRFVLSAGHGSMLLYALLHLSGYDLSLDEIKNFRQWNSKTPGHPELGVTPGVETTTGPLGQGVGNSVGMAIAEAWMAATFNTDQMSLVDHYTYVLCGDGDLEEGVSGEAVSLAGHLGLGKLIVIYDSNHITIEGSTRLSYSDDVKGRFKSYNWHVQEIDGHDRRAISRAISAARRHTEKPSIIIAETTIAFGSPNKAGTHHAHGAPLGSDEIKLTKKNLGWPEDEDFLVPVAATQRFKRAAARGRRENKAWGRLVRDYRKLQPEAAETWDRIWSGDLPDDLQEALPEFETGKSMATRKSAGMTLEALMGRLPNLLGGSADLAPSTNTYVAEYGSFSTADRTGRNFHFGVREHAMGAILNGMCYHGGVRPFGATFLVFADYMRPAIRLAALSHLNPTYVFTHDSIFVGEDGPTHQPVEQVASLRAIPNLTVIRPGDARESAVAWLAALENTGGPTALCLTRQGLETLDREKFGSADGVRQGAYHLTGQGQLTILASGSELGVALDVHALLANEAGIESRVVSFPSWELFEKQSDEYRSKTLGKGPRVAIEAGIEQGWSRYLGARGLFVGVDRFGASAPGDVLREQFGLTAALIVEKRILPWWKTLNIAKVEAPTQ